MDEATLRNRPSPAPDLTHNEYGEYGAGRELFANFRRVASDAESGATWLWGSG